MKSSKNSSFPLVLSKEELKLKNQSNLIIDYWYLGEVREFVPPSLFNKDTNFWNQKIFVSSF